MPGLLTDPAAPAEPTGGDPAAPAEPTGGDPAPTTPPVTDPPVGDPAPANAPEGTPAPVTEPPAEWYSKLPADIKALDPDSKIIGKYKTQDEAVRGLINAQRLIGKDSIPVPINDSDWETVYDRLGRPKDVDGYNLKAPKDAQVSPEMNAAFRQSMFKAGLNPAQADLINDFYWDSVDSAHAAQIAETNAERTATTAALQTQWGPDYKSNLLIADRTLNEIVPEALRERVTESGLTNNKGFIEFLNTVGRATLSDLNLIGNGSGEGGALTVDSIQAKIEEIKGSPEYLDSSHPNHKRSVETSYKLRQQLAALAKPA